VLVRAPLGPPPAGPPLPGAVGFPGAAMGVPPPALPGAGTLPFGPVDLRGMLPRISVEVPIHRALGGRQYYFLMPMADATLVGLPPPDPNRKPG
jgi:hypothetical protein